MARSRETKIELTAYDDLFQTDESREEAKLSKIRDIPISEIDEFPDHPFKVLMDEDMEQLVESIKRNGVMTPATVRLSITGSFFRSVRQNIQSKLQEVTMKIPKLFKKAAAFVMAAVTALSIMPATAFAAGDIGTISFSHTYDSNGNAMRYNSSANIGDYTAGGTGNYKYRMFVDGENAFCIQPGVPLKTGNTLKKASSDTWNALSANQKKAVGLQGYPENRR